MDAARPGNRRGNCCPSLPSSGDGNRRRTHERAGDTVEVKFQRSSGSGAGSPEIDAADSGAKINVLKMRPVAVVGEADVIAAACIRSGLRLQPKLIVVTGSLNLRSRSNDIAAVLSAAPRESSPR